MFREEFTQSTSLSDDSDGEADRRQNLIFKKYDTIDPTEDADLLKTRALHMRAKSLPPPMHVRVEPPASGEGGEEANAESSLDRKPSYLRGKRGSVSPEPYVCEGREGGKVYEEEGGKGKRGKEGGRK